MSPLNSSDNKDARQSTGALLGAVALHAAALWGLIMLPPPFARLPETLEFSLLGFTAQLEKAEPSPRQAPAQPPRPALAVPTAAESEPQRTEQEHVVATAQTTPASSARSEATTTAAMGALPAAVAESSPVFDAAYLRNATPPYPALSRRLREEGRVMLQVRVNPQGQPVSVAVHASSGFKRLDSAAREAVEGWSFVPARRGNIPIEATVLVPLVFNLER